MDMNIFMKQSRLNSGLTQKDAANRIGVSEATIQNWETGRTKFPDIQIFGNIIRVYHIDKELLLKSYIDTLRKEITNIQVKPDTVIVLADENFENFPNEEDFEKVLKINPYLKTTNITINIFNNTEQDIIDVLCTLLIDEDLPSIEKTQCKILISNSVKVLKRLIGYNTTLQDLSSIIWNIKDIGRTNYVMPLRKLKETPDGNPMYTEIYRENLEIIDWFLNDYYQGIGCSKYAPKSYNNTNSLRYKLNELLYDPYLKKIFIENKNRFKPKEEYLMNFGFVQNEESEKNDVKIENKDKNVNELDFNNLPDNTLIIFQCFSKDELFYKVIDKMLKHLEQKLKIKQLNQELEKNIEIRR